MLKEDIFLRTSCLTKEQLEGYVKNTLSKDELRAVELHMTSCELCSAAIDANLEFEKVINLNHVKFEIPTSKVISIKSTNSNRHYKWMSFAAFLIILVASTFIFVNTETVYDEFHKVYPSINPIVRGTELNKDEFNTALQLYEAAKYTEGIASLNKVQSSNDTIQTLVTLYIGLSNLELNNLELAKLKLESISSGIEEIDQVANWYLCLTLLRMEQNDKAKLAAEKISKSNSDYANQAFELLKRL